MNPKLLKAHLGLFGANAMWGLMAPIGKSAMAAGITNLSLASSRMIGAALLFWIASLFGPKEKVSKRDLVLLFFAALLAIVFNQGMYIFGLSYTSPIDASIITTSLPVITMILAALFLKEPITSKKAIGVVMGAAGAIILILGNHGTVGGTKNIVGDLACLAAQCSFASYLIIFKSLIGRYHTFTLMKWMFTYASLSFLPFSIGDLSAMFSTSFPLEVWLEVGYVVVFGTFFAYILMLTGQKALRPTIISMYNYVQPLVGSIVSVCIGIGVFGWSKGFASLLIFAGVYVVTQSKSREQVEKEKNS